MTSRAAQQTWSSAWQTAPPSACSTLRNNGGVVNWGYTCVFPEEGEPTINPVNTACLPWAASSTTAQAFFSPATVCPTSWSAVATQTSGVEWIDGETGLLCCPAGFEADGDNCRPGSTGTFPVVQCGEADAEENEYMTYSGAAWPTYAAISIAALQMRFQASDIGSVSATTTRSGTTGSSTSTATGSGNTGGGGGLSTGAKIAIGVIVPVVFLLGALAAFLLWRRRRNKKAARLQAARLEDEKHDSPPPRRSLDIASTSPYPYPTSEPLPGPAVSPGIATVGVRSTGGQHETPEWNHEMDATETERQGPVAGDNAPGQYVAYQPPPGEMDVGGSQNVPSELGGLARVPRKPIAPVEIDGRPWRAELSGAR